MTHRLTAILLIAFHFALFAGVWIGSEVLLAGDLLYLHYPMKADAGRQWVGGRIPEWNEGRLNGQPAAANPNVAVWYAPNLAMASDHPVRTGSRLLAAHHLWLLVGFLLLARRRGAEPWATAVGALVLTLSGPVLASVSYYNLLVGLSWLPWFMLCRSSPRLGVRTAGPALIVAVAVLAGSPFAVFAVVVVGLAAEVVAREDERWRRSAELLAAAAVGAVAAMVQLLPAIVLYPHTLRAIPKPYEASLGHYSFHPLRAVELVAPHFFGNAAGARRHEFWGGGLVDGGTGLVESPYVGVTVVVILVLLLRGRSTLLAAAAALALVVALGRFGGVHEALATVVPPLAQLRFPEKYLLLIPPLLAAGAITMEPDLRTSRWRIGVGLAIASAALISALVGLSGAEAWLPSTAGDELGPAEIDAAVVGMRRALVSSAVLSLGVVLIVAGRISATLKGPLLVLLVAADLGTSGVRTLPTIPASSIVDEPPLATALKRDGCARLLHHALGELTPGPAIDPDAGFTAVAWEGLHPRAGNLHGIRYSLDPPVDQMETAGSGSLSMRLASSPDLDPTLLGLLGVSHILHRAVRPPCPVEWTRPVGVAHLSRLGGAHELFFAIGGEIKGPVEIVDRPAELAWTVRLRDAGRLLTTISAAPGWAAAIDGDPAVVEETPWGTIAVPAPAGEHVVELSYRTPGLGVGLVVSAVMWLLLLGWLAVDLAGGKRVMRARGRAGLKG